MEERPRSHQSDVFMLQTKNVEIITAQRYDTYLWQMEWRLTNHILAVSGSSLWITLQSQNLNLITTNLNSYSHKTFARCFAEQNRTPGDKLLSVSLKCFSLQANIMATVVSNIQQIKSKRFNSRPVDEREAPFSSKRRFHATNEKRWNHNGSKIWCVNANVRKKQLHHRSNSRRALS